MILAQGDAEADMKTKRRTLANSDITEIVLATPVGHQHLRATIKLQSGEEIVLQEATVANLVRAYVGIKTHPFQKRCHLIGRNIDASELKTGFAQWQLIEQDLVQSG